MFVVLEYICHPTVSVTLKMLSLKLPFFSSLINLLKHFLMKLECIHV